MLLRYLLPAAALLGLTNAQTTSDCNPRERDDCDPNPALGTSHDFNFNSTPNGGLWENLAGTVLYEPDNGAKFTIAKQGDSPTIRTKFYFFGGRTEVWLKVAKGKGIVSSMMWLSDDLDEVDWEFLGTNDTHAQTNYYGKGEQDWLNGKSHPMTGMHDDYHNYTCHWTKDKLEWYIDSNLVRTLVPDEANKTRNYPQTPMRMSLGIWAGGDPTLPEGTREWAGGETDYDGGPYDMYVKSAVVEDYSTGKEYVWGDRSGSWDSIKITEGNSTAVEIIEQKPESTESSWSKMSDTGKIGVYAGSAVGGSLLLGALLFYCIRQRRRGTREARLADEKTAADKLEMAHFRKEGINPDDFTEHGQEFNSRDMREDGSMGANAYNVPDTPGSGTFEAAGATMAGGAAGAAGYAAVRSQSPRIKSPAPSSYHDARSTRSPAPGGLGAPPGAAFHDARSQHSGNGTPPPLNSPFQDQPSPQHGGFDFGVLPNSPHRGPSRVSSPFDDPNDVHSPQQGTFGGPSPYEGVRSQSPMSRTQSPMIRSQSPMIRSQSPGMPPQRGLPPSPHGMPVRTETPPSAYSRMNSPPSQQGYADRRPNPANARNYSGVAPEYRGQQGGDNWN